MIAVTAKTNHSKADQDPSTWLPPFEPARCEYITDFVKVKKRWGLSIDPSEEAALSETATRCPNITITLAR